MKEMQKAKKELKVLSQRIIEIMKDRDWKTYNVYLGGYTVAVYDHR